MVGEGVLINWWGEDYVVDFFVVVVGERLKIDFGRKDEEVVVLLGFQRE